MIRHFSAYSNESFDSSLVSLGAFITLFAVAIDPLSQQLIAYRTDSKPTDVNATIPIAVSYLEVLDNFAAVIGPGWKDLQKVGLSPTDYSYISVGMKTAVQSGLANGNERVLELPATCPGGNCTFGDYSSLAVCVSFADVTEHLREVNHTLNKATGSFQDRLLLTDDNYLVKYGGDKDLHSIQGDINISSVATSFKAPEGNTGLALLNFNQSIAFKDLPFPLADMFLITRNGSVPAEKKIGNFEFKYAAFEIALSWCIQSYTTEVINATSITRRLSDNRNFTWHDGTNSLVNDAPHPGHPVRGWKVDGRHHASLQWHLKQLFSGERTESGTSRSATSDVAQVLYDPFEDLGFGGPKGNISEQLHQTEREGLRLTFDSVAASMTNRVRRMTTPSSEAADTFSDRYLVNTANGTVFVQVTLVHIRWPWITAHACFALFSFGLLVATIISHGASPLRGMEPWKSSGVAILHALEPGLQREMGGVVKMSEVQELCRQKQVRLDNIAGVGWMLVEVEDNKEVR
jgi:hypothetical protein